MLVFVLVLFGIGESETLVDGTLLEFLLRLLAFDGLNLHLTLLSVHIVLTFWLIFLIIVLPFSIVLVLLFWIDYLFGLLDIGLLLILVVISNIGALLWRSALTLLCAQTFLIVELVVLLMHLSVFLLVFDKTWTL